MGNDFVIKCDTTYLPATALLGQSFQAMAGGSDSAMYHESGVQTPPIPISPQLFSYSPLSPPLFRSDASTSSSSSVHTTHSGLPRVVRHDAGEESRRRVSAPLSNQPPRSPLSRSTGFPHASAHQRISPNRKSAPFPKSPSASSHPKLSKRRRSSFSLGSLVGSYEHSILTGRMSASPSTPLPFSSSIGVLGDATSPISLRCPPHLALHFGALFYSGPGSEVSSPYVGAIDLESHYASRLGTQSDRLPRFPGYQVPQVGQVQVVIKNANATTVKLFLIPYDLTGLDRNGQGGKTFLRQKSYTVDESSAKPDKRGRLRHAIHLQFCSPPISSSANRKARSDDFEKAPQPRFYLHSSIRVVFASKALDWSEKYQVVLEGPEGEINDVVVKSSGIERFAPYIGPGKDWELARKQAKAKAGRAATDQILVSGRNDEDAHFHDPDHISESFEEQPFEKRSLLNTPPSPTSDAAHISLSDLSDALSNYSSAKRHPSSGEHSFPAPFSAALVFTRRDSVGHRPHRSGSPSSMSNPSGLSLSRPGSRAGSVGTRGRGESEGSLVKGEGLGR